MPIIQYNTHQVDLADEVVKTWDWTTLFKMRTQGAVMSEAYMVWYILLCVNKYRLLEDSGRRSCGIGLCITAKMVLSIREVVEGGVLVGRGLSFIDTNVAVRGEPSENYGWLLLSKDRVASRTTSHTRYKINQTREVTSNHSKASIQIYL